MKIALLAHHVAPIRPPFAGGVESLTWYVARWLAARGHDVVAFAPPESAIPGVEIRELELDPHLSAAARADVSMPPAAFMAAHHAYQHVLTRLARDDEGFDVIHSHSLHYLPVVMAAVQRAPVVVTLHTPPTPWLEAALISAPIETRTLTAVSHATARLWPDVGPRRVIANGVDTEAWAPGEGGDGAVWAGRMVPEKAPHMAIDAARRAGFELRLAGPIVDGVYWEREIAPRLGADVHYEGHLGHAELNRLLGGAQVAILSPVWDEPFGLVAAEAMACGTPVAAFARGGLVDVVDPAAGCLAAANDVSDLAGAVGRAARLDRGGVRRHAVAHLSIDAMGRKYEELYERMAAGSLPPAVREPA